MYKKHSIKERLMAVKLCLSGMSPWAIRQKFGISDTDVNEWVERYKLYGIKGLDRQPIKDFTFEEKCEIICEYREKHVSLHVICARYLVSQSRIYNWCKVYDQFGYEGLRETKNRGRPPKIMGRPKKREPQTELEKLQRENEYLRAENAYLKKLRALVLEKEAQKRKNEL